MAIDLFSIGKFTVHGYGLMIGLGFIAAVLAGSYLAKKKGLSDDHFTSMAVWVLVVGFMGGKLLHIIVEFKAFLANPMAVLGSEGFVVYGGIITGILSIVVYCRVKKLNCLDYLDLFGAAVPINQSLGRIGCFLAGCCYGRETDSAIGVVFPEGCIAPAGVKLLPTQLFMAAGDFIIFIALSVYLLRTKAVTKPAVDVAVGEDSAASGAGEDSKDKKNKKPVKLIEPVRVTNPGCTTALYLVLYSIGRFIIEFFRNDVRGSVGALSTSQFIAIFSFIGGVAVYILIARGKKSESRPENKPDNNNVGD